MPGDIGGIVPQEVRHVELLPELLAGFLAQPCQPCKARCLVHALVQDGIRILDRPAEVRTREVKEIFEQLSFPRVPDLGAGAAYISNREQVKRGQLACIAHQCGEIPDNVRIGQVLFLGHLRHGKVVADQEGDQPAVGIV